MKLGMNLLLWTDDATGDGFWPTLERLKEMGFDGVELPVFDLVPEKFAKLGRRLDDLGLQRTAVTVRGAQDDPISADPAIRRRGIELTCRAIDCCVAGGMTRLVGPYYAALGVFSGSGPTPEEWQRGVDSMSQVADYAGQCGVTLSLEFLNRFEIYLLNCAADASRFVREVNHERCRLLYDTFHAHIEEKSVRSAILSCASDLDHVHISESDRSTPGQGQVRWDDTFDSLAAMGYDGWLTIEAFGQRLPALAAATKIWRRMFVSEEQLAADGLAFIKSRWAAASAKHR